MILTAHQPAYLPWLGLFHKIALADRYVFLDTVQYQRNDYNNRNQIKTPAGPVWLSVPVHSKNHLHTRICDVTVVADGWQRNHLKSIEQNYRKAPFFADYFDALRELLGHEHVCLTDLAFDMLLLFLRLLGIETPVARASDYDFAGAKSDLILDMCLKLGATAFIFGGQGRNYVNVDSFLEHGVTPCFQDYRHPVYPQLHGNFAPYMSVLDLLFNAGPATYETLMSGNAATLAELIPPSTGREAALETQPP